MIVIIYTKNGDKPMKTKKEIIDFIQNGYDSADARCDESGVEAWDYLSGVLDRCKTPMASLKVYKKDLEYQAITIEQWDALRCIIQFIEN